MALKEKRKIVFSACLFLLVVAVILICISKAYNIGDFAEALHKAKKHYLIMGAGCILIFIICESVNIGRTLAAMGVHKSPANCLKYGAAGYFFSGITPSASGGQPMQLYSMNKDKIPVSFGSLALITELASFQIVSIVMVIVSFILQRNYLFSLSKSVTVAISLGAAGNTFFCMLLLALLFSDRAAVMIESFLVWIVMHLGKKEKAQSRTDRISLRMREYKKGSEYIRTNPRLLIKNIITTVIQNTAVFSIPYFTYLSLGGTGGSWIQIVCIQSLLTAAVSIVPLPGGTGAGEVGFVLLFLPIFGKELIAPGMLISRGLGFYLGIVISGLMFAGIAIYDNIKRKKKSIEMKEVDNKKTALIITGKFGMGHVSAANAIKEELLEMNRDMNIEIVDFIEYLFPHINSYIYSTINYVTRRFNRVYNLINKIDENSTVEVMGGWLSGKIDYLVKLHDPEVIISTWPVGARYIGCYKQKNGCEIPFVTCITDIKAHREWVSECTDAYLVGDRSTAEELMAYGVSEECIFIGGIPVRQKFDIPREKRSTGQKEVLIMGGGLGLIIDSDRLLSLLAGLEDIHITVITGDNKKLYNDIRNKYPDVTVMGFIDNVDDYMRAADILITKAGGITVFEAIHSETPLLLFKPFLSQEEGNTDFVLRNNIGMLIDTSDPDNLVMQFSDSAIEEMRENMRQLKEEYSSRNMAMAIKYAGFQA